MDAPFPAAAKLGDKKNLKLMRTSVFTEWKDGGWNRSAAAIVKDGGIGPFHFELPEDSLVAIEDAKHKEAAYAYWYVSAPPKCPHLDQGWLQRLARRCYSCRL